MKLGNKYIILALIGLFGLESIHAQWVTEKSPSINNLNSVSLINDHSGWIVGDNGTMIYKADSYWINYKQVTDENLYSVFILDKNDGWAVGSKGIILHFDGDKWESVPSPTREKLYSISFRDHKNGIAVGSKGTVVIYENGAWRLAKKTTRGDLYSVSSKNDLSLIGGGLECVNIPVMKMVDNAEKTLINSFDPFYIEIKSIAQTEHKNAWAVGSPGTIFHFDGYEWKKIDSDSKLPSLNCVFFSEDNNGLSVGFSGTILTYCEKVWTKQNSPVKVKLNGAAISGNTYYAVGDNGTILSWKQAAENALASVTKHNTAIIKIEVYPNPTSDNLNVIIPYEEGFVAEKIFVSNVYGQSVLNYRIYQDNGSQVYQINTSQLPDGLYLLSITSSGRIGASGKFIVKH